MKASLKTTALDLYRNEEYLDARFDAATPYVGDEVDTDALEAELAVEAKECRGDIINQLVDGDALPALLDFVNAAADHDKKSAEFLNAQSALLEKAAELFIETKVVLVETDSTDGTKGIVINKRCAA